VNGKLEEFPNNILILKEITVNPTVNVWWQERAEGTIFQFSFWGAVFIINIEPKTKIGDNTYFEENKGEGLFYKFPLDKSTLEPKVKSADTA